LIFSPLDLGDHLYQEGSYEEAITEYERSIFFADSTDDVRLGLERISRTYREMGEWHLSADRLLDTLAFRKEPNGSARTRIAVGLDLVRAGESDSANYQFRRVVQGQASKEIRTRARLLMGIVDIHEHRWESARANLMPSLKDAGLLDRSIHRIEKRLMVPVSGTKSPKLAAILSAVLPGLGQIYAGEWRSGINAFVLNGLIVLWAIREMRSGDLGDGVLILSFIFPRYYQGNIRNSVVMAKKRSEIAGNRKADSLISMLREMAVADHHR
jgi:hypothetical protein